MTRRDILLGEQTDVNEISTILGTCRVIHRKPISDNQDDFTSNPKGAFFCRYNIKIELPNKSSQKGKITIIPYDGPDEDDEEGDDLSYPPTKRSRGNSTVSQGSNIEGTTEGSDGDSVDDDNDDDDDESSQGSSEKRIHPSITEGSSNLKIKVGSEHQAEIPMQSHKRRYSSSREAPIEVWKPQEITDAKLNSYFTDATKILKEYMEKKGMSTTRSLPHNVPPGLTVPDENGRLSSFCEYREINVDDLLYLLHDHEYNTTTALKGLAKYPEDYLYIWTKEDVQLYNAGFQKHASNLHSIGKNLNDTKDHKDVVDYHYRFKIPDQFKRYQDLKREQARKMLETSERLRLNEYLSEGSIQGSNNGTMNGMRKSQLW